MRRQTVEVIMKLVEEESFAKSRINYFEEIIRKFKSRYTDDKEDAREQGLYIDEAQLLLDYWTSKLLDTNKAIKELDDNVHIESESFDGILGRVDV